MALMCSDKDFLATRIGYKLALQGPCVTVQSACSTSLVALHTACQALLAQECDMALAGGACVKVPQAAGYLYREGGMLSRDGTCRPFDAEASGTVFGSGAGIVVLKRHLDALADGDDILAVIAGTAINNDGNRKASYTAPSVEGISEVVRQALEFADLPPHAVGYVECHGTGTALGDPIEVRALRAALGGDEASHPGCLLGSVKGHVGHLESAAGIAGFIKAVCCVREAWLPPTLHFRQANPLLGIQESFLEVVGAGRPWADARPRVAAVVSLGVGGTNAAALVRQATLPPPPPTGCRWHALPCSARSREALQAQLDAMRTLPCDAAPEWLADVSWTLSVGRQAHAWRAAWVVDGHSGQAVLIPPCEVRTGLATTPSTTLYLPSSAPARPCDEPLWASLAAALRSEIDRTAGAARANGAGAASLQDFVVRVATARWWHALGVTVSRKVADGPGSLAAAYLDGAWTLEQVLKTIADAAAGDCELLHVEPTGLHVADGTATPPRTLCPLPPQRRVESIADLRRIAPEAVWITLENADGTFAGPGEDEQQAPGRVGRVGAAARASVDARRGGVSGGALRRRTPAADIDPARRRPQQRPPLVVKPFRSLP